MSPQLQMAIQQKLSGHFSSITTFTVRAVGGGSINAAYQLQVDDYSVFCKVNSATKFPGLFSKERNGLALIGKQSRIQVPTVIDCFDVEEQQVLLLDWIEEGERTLAFWKKFGEQLAALHQLTAPTFGLHEDNYIGNVPQSNMQQKDWSQFFYSQRLQPLLHLCTQKKLLPTSCSHQFEKLFPQLPQIFGTARQPSLVHGDLWSGNFMCSKAGDPVLIDPAVYFGHRSADLGFTTLFGGFHAAFYEAYHYHSPLPSNHKEQWKVCNLYPLLVHLYLFGGSYLSSIRQTLAEFA